MLKKVPLGENIFNSLARNLSILKVEIENIFRTERRTMGQRGGGIDIPKVDEKFISNKSCHIESVAHFLYYIMM